MKPRLPLSDIRNRLNIAFDESELRGFCLDYFGPVYDKFDAGMQNNYKITLLLDYCRRHPTGFKTLLSAVRYEVQLYPNRGDVLSPLIECLGVYLKHLAKEPSLMRRQEGHLYGAFLKLDYREQALLFRRVGRQRASAFLIHGPQMFGQRWLLKRLVTAVLKDGGSKFSFRLRRSTRRVGLDALWAEVCHQLGLDSRLSATGVVDKVFELWKTQNVVLIFDEIDFMSEVYLKQFIRTFWLRLKQKGLPDGSFRLFMFLVDHSEEVNCWNLPFDEPLTVTHKPYTIVKLPVLTAFDESHLTDWAATHDFLPVELTEQGKALQIIAESQDGTPELVMRHICEEILGCSWFNGVEKCLTY